MKNQWDTYATLYDQGIGLEGDALHAQFVDPIFDDFLGSVTGKTILDAGCGNGYLALKFGNKPKHMLGADSSEELLQFAKNNTKRLRNVSFVQMDLSKQWKLKPKSFDIVIANMLLQYLPLLELFAKESVKVLKPKGLLIITIDHPAHALFARAQELAGKKNDKFIPSGSYLTQGLRKKRSLWDQAVLEYYHRPVEGYINPFTKYFHLESMKEVSEDNEMPRILGLKWVKEAG